MTHACIDCGLEDKLYERHRCQRCALRRRTGELLRAGGEAIPPELVAVHDAITATATPRTALNWLRNGAGAAVLADLAAGTTPISHAALDAHPRRRGADYLRHVLVAAGVLPARDEPLARLEAWVATLLTAVQQPEHRRLLHAYATWRVLRRLRRRAARNTAGPTPTGYSRTQLLVATRFLAWLDQTGPTLAQCRQRDVDTWLAKGPAGYPVRDFLDWAAEHHHCPALLVPALGRTTGAATEADTRWALIARLLHDDTLELTDRVAGAFLLCYGQQLVKYRVFWRLGCHASGGCRALILGGGGPSSACDRLTSLVGVKVVRPRCARALHLDASGAPQGRAGTEERPGCGHGAHAARCWRRCACSCSTGGIRPSSPCSRRWLYQST